MGILTRQQGDVYVITSDRAVGAARTVRAPARLGDDYQVWTGSAWSVERTEAISFASLDAADEYVRANFTQVTG